MMKAMILAAGRGERMRPLTDSCPKPLLKVKGVPLIERHVKNLVHSGITEIIINHAWLGEQIESYLGSGEKYGAKIFYSAEKKALETAGGIKQALPLLAESDDDVFLVVNGDIYCDVNLGQLPTLADDKNAHVVLVNNPDHNLGGDFTLNAGLLENPTDNKLVNTFTFSGIALYRKAFFKQTSLLVSNHSGNSDNIESLAPLLRASANNKQVSAHLHVGHWTDVGTPERLAQLNA
jgi:MurNAc alpha-1-phosphate uridylyltransferase